VGKAAEVDPRREAEERVGGRFETRVLVPSPPAVDQPPFFADDPVAVDERTGDRPVVSPVSNAQRTWDALAREEPDLRDWCAERWLGAWQRLPDPPVRAEASRWGLHALAEWVLSPARAAANGKIGLRYTHNGFGTPFFLIDGVDRQVRMEGAELVVDTGDAEQRHPLTTLSAAAEIAGADLGADKVYTPTTAPDEDAPARIEPAGAAFYGAWFGLAASVLEELRVETAVDENASRVQLWPEHFDLSFELGDEASGRRAGYGCSPGDSDHPLPYAYVVPWAEVPPDPYWGETHFRGASLEWDAIAAASDQRAGLLDFFRRGRDLLRMLPPTS
jgi:hypothetical protein